MLRKFICLSAVIFVISLDVTEGKTFKFDIKIDEIAPFI